MQPRAHHTPPNRVCMCVEEASLGYDTLKRKRKKRENVCISVCILLLLPQLYPDGRRAECAKLTETRKRHSL